MRDNTKTLTIATHAGTCTDVVKHIVESRGHKFVVVKDQKTAYNVHFDRLILLGGADIHPFFYGEPSIESQPGDRGRDAIEWIMVRRAMQDDIPTMGICRGHQMLTIAHGGSLHQDISTCLRVSHGNSHVITVKKVLKDHIPSARVNSLHHQCVNKVPIGFTVTAHAGDVIESIYRPGFLGVQWHPEMMYRADTRWGRLFDWWLEGLK